MNIDSLKSQFVSLSHDIQNIDESKFDSLQEAIQNNQQKTVDQLACELADEVLLVGPEQDALPHSLAEVQITYKPGLLVRMGRVITGFFGLTDTRQDNTNLKNALKVIQEDAKYISLEGYDENSLRLRTLNVVLTQIINQANHAEQDREEILTGKEPYIPIPLVLWNPPPQRRWFDTLPPFVFNPLPADFWTASQQATRPVPHNIRPLRPPSVYDIPEGAGIMNGGLTCFLDATLQALRYCKGFREFLRLSTSQLDGVDYEKTMGAINECQKNIEAIHNYFDEADRSKYDEYVKRHNELEKACQIARDNVSQFFKKSYDDLDASFKDVVAFMAQEQKNYKPLFPGDVFEPIIANFGNLQTKYNEYSQKRKDLSDAQYENIVNGRRDYDTAVVQLEKEYRPIFENMRAKRAAWIVAHRDEIKLHEDRIRQLGKTEAVKNKVKKRLFDCMQYVETQNTPWPAEETRALRDDLVRLSCDFPRGVEHDANEAFRQILSIIGFPEFQQRELVTFANPIASVPSYQREKKHDTRSLRFELTPAVGNLQQFFAPIQTSANLSNEDVFKLIQNEPYKSNEALHNLVGSKKALSSADVNLLQKQKLLGNIDNLPIQKQVEIDTLHPPKLLHIDLARNALGFRDTSPVTIPDTLQISQVTFRLKGAVIHAGAGRISEAGHFLTLCPRWSQDGVITHWVAFDDAMTMPIYDMESPARYEAKSFRQLLDENAYGLYYEPVQAQALPQALPAPTMPIIASQQSVSTQSSQAATSSNTSPNQPLPRASRGKKRRITPTSQAKPKKIYKKT